jgi:predicted CopG family antitoxin
MSTKTIAVDTRVYEKLASVKREGESFSKAIDRLIDQVGSTHTGGEILSRLAEIPVLSSDDSAIMLAKVAENREEETWDELDLR